MHTPTRRGKPGRSHVLYWFRTPPGVRIGRKPFSEDVQRMLEAQNPGVAFDWPVIISTPMPPPDMTEFWRERRKAERAARQERRAEEATESPDAASEVVQPEPVNAGRAEPAASAPRELVRAPGSELDASALPSPAVAASPAPDAAPAAGQTDEQTARKKRRRRGGRRRKGPGEAMPQEATSGGDSGPLDDAGSADEEPDDPSGDVDSASEGE